MKMNIKNYMKIFKIKKIINKILLSFYYFYFPSIVFMENKNITNDILLIILVFLSSIFFTQIYLNFIDITREITEEDIEKILKILSEDSDEDMEKILKKIKENASKRK